MTEAPSNGSTSGDEAVTVRAEAIRTAAISAAPKHRRLLQSASGGPHPQRNHAPGLRYLHTPWARVLTTTGRKTGQQRRNYVRAIRRHDKVYVVMLRPPALAIERPWPSRPGCGTCEATRTFACDCGAEPVPVSRERSVTRPSCNRHERQSARQCTSSTTASAVFICAAALPGPRSRICTATGSTPASHS